MNPQRQHFNQIGTANKIKTVSILDIGKSQHSYERAAAKMYVQSADMIQGFRPSPQRFRPCYASAVLAVPRQDIWSFFRDDDAQISAVAVAPDYVAVDRDLDDLTYPAFMHELGHHLNNGMDAEKYGLLEIEIRAWEWVVQNINHAYVTGETGDMIRACLGSYIHDHTVTHGQQLTDDHFLRISNIFREFPQ